MATTSSRDFLGDTVNFKFVSGLDSFSDVLAASRQEGAHVVITTGADSSVRLDNIQLSSLTESDFIF